MRAAIIACLALFITGCESDESDDTGMITRDFTIADHWSDPIKPEEGDTYSAYTTDGTIIRYGNYTRIMRQRESCSGMSGADRVGRGDYVEIQYDVSKADLRGHTPTIKAMAIKAWRAECTQEKTNTYSEVVYER